MTRREFLKALGLSAAVAAVPIDVLASYPHFNPALQYGDWVEVTDVVDKLYLQEIQQLFAEQIKQSIPALFRDDIEWIVIQPRPSTEDPLLVHGSVGWKYTPNKT